MNTQQQIINKGYEGYKKWLKWHIENGGHVTRTEADKTGDNLVWVLAKEGDKYIGGSHYNLVIPANVKDVHILNTKGVNVYSYSDSFPLPTAIPQFQDCLFDHKSYILSWFLGANRGIDQNEKSDELYHMVLDPKVSQSFIFYAFLKEFPYVTDESFNQGLGKRRDYLLSEFNFSDPLDTEPFLFSM